MQYCTGRSNQERRSAHNETDTSIIMQKPPDSIPVLVNVQELDWPVPSYYTSQTTQTKRVSWDYHPLPTSKIQPACLLLRSSQHKAVASTPLPSLPIILVLQPHHGSALHDPQRVVSSSQSLDFIFMSLDVIGKAFLWLSAFVRFWAYKLCPIPMTSFILGKNFNPLTSYASIQMWEIGHDWMCLASRYTMIHICENWYLHLPESTINYQLTSINIT